MTMTSPRSDKAQDVEAADPRHNPLPLHSVHPSATHMQQPTRTRQGTQSSCMAHVAPAIPLFEWGIHSVRHWNIEARTTSVAPRPVFPVRAPLNSPPAPVPRTSAPGQGCGSKEVGSDLSFQLQQMCNLPAVLALHVIFPVTPEALLPVLLLALPALFLLPCLQMPLPSVEWDMDLTCSMSGFNYGICYCTERPVQGRRVSSDAPAVSGSNSVHVRWRTASPMS